MKARRYELTDKEWELIRPLIPISHTGRPQKDIRAHLNGILWLARSGARWSDLPARFGPHQTVYSLSLIHISLSFTSTLVVAWTQSRPGANVLGIRE